MQKFRLKSWLTVTILFIILLAGCSKTIVSDVTRFHNLPTPDAETIEVVSMDPALQNSLEFGQYANLVGQHLGKVGYSPPNGPTSKLIARIGYAIQTAEGIIEGGPRTSVAIGASGGSRHSGVGVGISIPLGKSEPRQEYVRILSLEIIRRSDGLKLYEGHVSSRGQEGLPIIMPYLVDALFQDFPGETGTSNKVKVTPAQ